MTRLVEDLRYGPASKFYPLYYSFREVTPTGVWWPVRHRMERMRRNRRDLP